MARQRTPNSKAEVLGRTQKDPQRYRKRTNPAVEPLGDPPAWLSKEAKLEWKTLDAEIPWLKRSDRALVSLTATLAVAIKKDPLVNMAALTEYRRQLCALGGSPADRSKIHAPDDDDADDPAREFIN